MKPGGGGKGPEFEREICKKLSLWLSKGERQDLFWRSAMSGGRATLLLRQGVKAKSQASDITSIDEASTKFAKKYIVECKFYKDLEPRRLIYKNDGQLVAFWVKVLEDANEYDKHPCMIFRQNFFPNTICFGKNIMSMYGNGFMGKQCPAPLGIFPAINMIMFNFQDFTDNVAARRIT